MGQLANVIINGLDTFPFPLKKYPSLVCLCRLNTTQTGQTFGSERMKNSLIKNDAICLLFFYLLFIVWPGMCSVIPLCAES
jgi:hypothetical protein